MNELLLDTGTYSLSYGDFFIRLLVSLGIGMVIGLERQYAAMKEGVQGYFGIRTFAFFSLLGNLSGIVYFLFSPWAFIAIFLGTISLTSAAYWQAALQGDRGLTTELSALLTFVLGSLVSYGLISISLVITVVVLVFLSSKFQLRTFVGKITTEELYAFIRFVILALLIFPFLPDTPFGPYQALYPQEIGWVILLTSGLGFLGYILTKTFGGHKGILLTGLLGGLVSSTAITWVFAKKSKDNPSMSSPYATAILGASSMIYLRVLFWTGLFQGALFRDLLLPALVLFVVSTIVTFFTYTKGKNQLPSSEEVPLQKPLDLRSAFLFGVLYSVILLLVTYANKNLGHQGTLVSSTLAGFTDIDALSISIAKLSVNTLSIPLATLAILLACLSNTVIKWALGSYWGSPKLRSHLLKGFGMSTAACLLILLYFLLTPGEV